MTGSELYCKISGVRYVAGLFRYLYPSKGLSSRKMSITPTIIMVYLNLLPMRIPKKHIQEEVAYRFGIEVGTLGTLDGKLHHFCSQAYQAVCFEAPKYGVEIDTALEADIEARAEAKRARIEDEQVKRIAEAARCRAEIRRRARIVAERKGILNFSLTDEQIAEQLGCSVRTVCTMRVQYLKDKGIYHILLNRGFSVETVAQLTGLPILYVSAYRGNYMSFAHIYKSKLKLKRKTPEEVDSVISSGMIMHPVDKYCIASGFISMKYLCNVLLERSTEYDIKLVAYIINKRGSGVLVIDIAKVTGIHPVYVDKILLGLQELDTTAYNYAIGDVTNG